MPDNDRLLPFTCHVPEADLDDLRRRLLATRWPDKETVGDWSQGVPLAAMRALVEHWTHGYDWRRFERRLNAVPQLTTVVDGQTVHLLHVRSPHSGATPLVLTHGWPGSVGEFLDVLGPLTDPTRHGGSVEDAFHVVAPSPPGYGFSSRPSGTGWGIERIAGAWAEVMTRLGYERFGASGGDWGTSISTMLGLRHPDRVIGLHLTPPLVAPDPATFDDLTPRERESLDRFAEISRTASAYGQMHATRPQTLGYGLTDSPVGLAAWIFEKVVAWTDWERDVFDVVDRDRVLDTITLYWLTGTAASSARLYWESLATVEAWFTTTAPPVHVPTAASVFRDFPRPSRRWAERRFTDLRYWSEPPRGGHFPALEQPALFVDEARAAFRALR